MVASVLDRLLLMRTRPVRLRVDFCSPRRLFWVFFPLDIDCDNCVHRRYRFNVSSVPIAPQQMPMMAMPRPVPRGLSPLVWV